MCNQRERLIGYVYNEGDASELQEVQRHLDSCAECRTEIAALRSVREDLLAWDVPASESVWRPFTPAPVARPWFRQVPAWAMAAAATIVMASGFAGGSFAHRFGAEPTQATVTSAPAPASAGASAELAALDRIIKQLRDELGAMNARVESVANRPAVTRAVDQPAGPDLSASTDLVALRARVVQLQEQNAKVIEMLGQFGGRLAADKQTAEVRYGVLLGQLNALQGIVQQLVGSAK